MEPEAACAPKTHPPYSDGRARLSIVKNEHGTFCAYLGCWAIDGTATNSSFKSPYIPASEFVLNILVRPE